MSSNVSIIFETSHGAFQLKGHPNDSIRQILQKHGIPLVAVWTYTKPHVTQDSTTKPASFISAETRLAELLSRGIHQVYARASRNINYPDLPGLGKARRRFAKSATTEWTFPDPEHGLFSPIKAELNREDCLQMVKDAVVKVLADWPEDLPKRLVVGTSGGGDSNVMLTALVSSGFFAEGDLIPVMMLGIPDWDPLQEQARQLCLELGLELKAISGHAVEEVLGIEDLQDFFQTFKQFYPKVDLEFLGTWMLRKVLGSIALSENCRAVAIGANREDLVAEGFARIAQGLLPLSAPYRPFGPLTLVYPMWQIPKKIGDGAYIKRSLSNYQTRDPSFTQGRSAFYHLAYLVAEGAPGADLTLLDGFANVASLDSESVVWDEDLGDFLCREGSDPEAVTRWKTFLETTGVIKV